MEYKYRKIVKDDLDQLTNLIDICFKLKTKNKTSLVDWKFFQPKDSKLIAYGAFTESKLVSFYSNKDMEILLGKNKFRSAVCLDMATHPEHRRQGLISNLSKKTYANLSTNYDFSFGFSNGSGVNVDKFASDYGYVIVGQFQTYRRIIVPTFSKNNLKIEKVSNIISLESNSIDLYQINPSEKYLSWRYLHNAAHNNYDYYQVTNGSKLVGYSIVQRDNYKAGILKITACDVEAIDAILKATFNALAKDKARIVTMTVLPNVTWKNILKKNRFIRARKKEEYYLTVFPHQYKKNSIVDSERWLLMGGDLI